MPRGPERPWRAQKGPLLDAHIQASIAQGQDPATLHYGELIEDEFAPGQALNAHLATEFKSALYRAARRQGVSLVATIEQLPGGRHQIRFRAVDKAAARAYMIQRYGPDRSKWPYNPRNRTPKEGQ